jgi:hypothetical protein
MSTEELKAMKAFSADPIAGDPMTKIAPQTLGFSDWHYANPDEIFIRGGPTPDFKKGVVAGLRMAADMAVGDDLYMAQAMLMMAKQIEDKL